MRGWRHRASAVVAGVALAMASGRRLPAQSSEPAQSGQAGPSQGGFVFKTNAELVLTNVVVRDTKTGELVRGLRQNDFSIYENGKQQAISTFDFQSVDMATPLNEATVSGLAASASGNDSKGAVVARP